MKKSISSIMPIIFLSIVIHSFGQVTLENSKIKLITDGKHISSIFDKERGIEHIAPDYTAAGGLFGISYADSTTLALAGTENAAQFTSVSIQSHNAEEATFLLENNALTARVNVRLHSIKAETYWTISVQLKNNAYVVSQVNFPRFRTSQSLDGKYKQFVNPLWEGYMQSMKTAWAPYNSSYPGKQGLQMSACISDKGGIMLWADDTNGHVKSFGFLNDANSSNVAVRHLMPYNNALWTVTYNTMISLCGNAWQDAAEIYREWAVKQTWSSTPLRNRTDVSPKFHGVPLAISSQVNLEDLETLPTRLKAWADKFNTPVIYRPLGWEKYGNWKSIDYFPTSIGDENFADLNKKLIANKITTAGFIEGFHWYFKLDKGTEAQNEAILKYYNDHNGPGLIRTNQNGGLILAENNSKGYLCRGTEFGKIYQQGVAKKLFELGVTHFHNDFDHLTGADGVCFNKAHGHPVPYGPWESQIMKNVYSEVIAEAKKQGVSDFSLTKEWPCEIYNMTLHGYQARNWKVVREYKNLVPLFIYVYHDYIPVIFGLTTANQSGIEQSASIVYGQIQSIAFWNASVTAPNMNAAIEDVVNDYFDAMKGHAKDFLLYGRLLKPVVQSAPGMLHNTWGDDRGNIGLFAIDTLLTDASIRFQIPGTGLRHLSIFHGNTLVSKKQITGGEVVTWSVPKWRLFSAIVTDSPMSRTHTIKKNESRCYPNPVHEFLNINLNDLRNDFEVKIFDLSGKNIGQFRNQDVINVQNLDKGIYILSVKAGDDNTFHKVVKL